MGPTAQGPGTCTRASVPARTGKEALIASEDRAGPALGRQACTWQAFEAGHDSMFLAVAQLHGSQPRPGRLRLFDVDEWAGRMQSLVQFQGSGER